MNLYIQEKNEHPTKNRRLHIEGYLYAKEISNTKNTTGFLEHQKSTIDLYSMVYNTREVYINEDWRKRKYKTIPILKKMEINILQILINAGYKGHIKIKRLSRKLEEAIAIEMIREYDHQEDEKNHQIQ